MGWEFIILYIVTTRNRWEVLTREFQMDKVIKVLALLFRFLVWNMMVVRHPIGMGRRVFIRYRLIICGKSRPVLVGFRSITLLLYKGWKLLVIVLFIYLRMRPLTFRLEVLLNIILSRLACTNRWNCRNRNIFPIILHRTQKIVCKFCLIHIVALVIRLLFLRIPFTRNKAMLLARDIATFPLEEMLCRSSRNYGFMILAMLLERIIRRGTRITITVMR